MSAAISQLKVESEMMNYLQVSIGDSLESFPIFFDDRLSHSDMLYYLCRTSREAVLSATVTPRYKGVWKYVNKYTCTSAESEDEPIHVGNHPSLSVRADELVVCYNTNAGYRAGRMVFGCKFDLLRGSTVVMYTTMQGVEQLRGLATGFVRYLAHPEIFLTWSSSRGS